MWHSIVRSVAGIGGNGRSSDAVDVADDTFVRSDRSVLRALLDLDGAAEALWPHLRVSVIRDRGANGLKYAVTGPVLGDMEVWLEPHADGVLVHHYLRGVVAPGSPMTGRQATRAHTLAWKRVIHRIKDVLEERKG